MKFKKLFIAIAAAALSACLLSTPAFAATETITSSQGWKGGSSLSEDTTWTLQNGAIVTLEKPITIPSGKTLTLEGWGSFARHSTNTNALFIVQEGGKLVIEGVSEEKPFAIDGKDVIAQTSLIISSGELDFEYAVIQNGKNRSVYAEGHESAGQPNGQGGGIIVGSTGSLAMDHCVVTKNTASLNGGGIYAGGPVTIKNSEISWNRAMSSETGDPKVNAGRGGGFALAGDKGDGVFENVLVTQNAAMYYGGGGQISGKGSSLTISEGTVFSYNTAVLHGAGALHVTGDATFTMDGGSMENNFAQYCGGAIHSSYSCTLNLNSGTISGNVTNGRGAGVHVNTGGAITLNEGITISGNSAYKERVGTHAEVDATGDSWDSVKYEGSDDDFGYGGGVLIDSGTCTVAGATIADNYAEVGGGGIALTMLNMSDGGLDDLMVASFSMTSGIVSGNKTGGDGAGVYLMSNKARENLSKTYPADEGVAHNYNWAISQIRDHNRHIASELYGSVDEILNGIPVASVSGGTISGNEADGNGGGLYLGDNTKFSISGAGDISGNKAVNGGGAYVESGTAEIDGGTMGGNVASSNGGALYVSGDVTMTAGTIGGEGSANTALLNGGALYVSDGNFTMSAGAVSHNIATGNGGAAYVAGGDVLIEHGSLDSNKAVSGGAVYMAVADASLIMRSGTMKGNEATDDGGAIYANGGTIEIGLENCLGAVDKDNDGDVDEDDETVHNAMHADSGTGRHHPEISGNSADDTGGGIAIANDGIVRFYCGNATDNAALYKGVGKNVFMDGGEFYLYDGANVGVPRDPDLVIVGGELHNECANKEYINLYYYYQNTETETQMVGLAEYEEVMNLPDGEHFWPDYAEENGLAFIGWTAQGAASGNQSNEYVRHKQQYLDSGSPVQILDGTTTATDATGVNTNKVYDGTSDKAMHLYALWAPLTSGITYVDNVTWSAMTDDSTPTKLLATYGFSREGNVLSIGSVEKPGYELEGWYIYQDEGQNANWSPDANMVYEPDPDGFAPQGGSPDYSALNLEGLVYQEVNEGGVLELQAGNANFGDITLIANYVPQYGDLTISKTFPTGADYSVDENQSFVFHVSGTPANESLAPIEMDVVVIGDASVTIAHLPVGKYSVTEKGAWSWRYLLNGVTADVDDSAISVVNGIGITLTTDGERVAFSNEREYPYWLSGDSYAENRWGNGSDGAKVVARLDELVGA